MPKRTYKKRPPLRRRPAPVQNHDLARHSKIAGWEASARYKIHPGELLREKFMKPIGLTPQMMAAAIPRHPEFPDSDIAERIQDLIRADEDSFLDLHLALALDRYFGLSPGFFWRVQAQQEIRDWIEREQSWLAKVKPWRQAVRLRAPVADYGVVRVTTDNEGKCILPLPNALIRDFRAKAGDTITLSRRKAGGFFMRFYRRTRRGWLRLLPAGNTHAVKHPQ